MTVPFFLGHLVYVRVPFHMAKNSHLQLQLKLDFWNSTGMIAGTCEKNMCRSCNAIALLVKAVNLFLYIMQSLNICYSSSTSKLSFRVSAFHMVNVDPNSRDTLEENTSGKQLMRHDCKVLWQSQFQVGFQTEENSGVMVISC